MSHLHDNESANAQLIASILALLIGGIIISVIMPTMFNSILTNVPASELNPEFRESYLSVINLMQGIFPIMTVVVIITTIFMFMGMPGGRSGSDDESDTTNLASGTRYSSVTSTQPVTPMRPTVTLQSNVIVDTTQVQRHIAPPQQTQQPAPATLATHEDTHVPTRWETLDIVSDSED